MSVEATNYQEGNYVDYTPASNRTAGEVVEVAGRAGICAADITANVKGSAQIKGIVKVQKAQVAINKGVPVGWDENGNPYGGTAGTGAATNVLSAADFLLGSAIANAAATDTHVYVALNEFVEGFPTFAGFTFEEISANKTLDAQDVGKAFIVTADAKTITLPATASGLGPIVIINGGADAAVAVNVSPNANDKIMGPDIAGTDNKDLINTKTTAKQWDYIILEPDVAGNGWEVGRMRGTWATEG